LPLPTVASIGPFEAAWTFALSASGVSYSIALFTAAAFHALVLASALLLVPAAVLLGRRRKSMLLGASFNTPP
jgi:hypothetical protein